MLKILKHFNFVMLEHKGYTYILCTYNDKANKGYTILYI